MGSLFSGEPLLFSCKGVDMSVSEWIIAIETFALVVLTGCYVILTKKLKDTINTQTQESERSRKLSSLQSLIKEIHPKSAEERSLIFKRYCEDPEAFRSRSTLGEGLSSFEGPNQVMGTNQYDALYAQ